MHPGDFHAKYFTGRVRMKTHAARDKASKAQATIADEQIKTAKKGNKGVTIGKSVSRKARGHDAIYNGGALRSQDTDQPVAGRSYAPKGNKLKLPMEVPPVDQDKQPKDNNTERVKTFARKVFGKIGGV